MINYLKDKKTHILIWAVSTAIFYCVLYIDSEIDLGNLNYALRLNFIFFVFVFLISYYLYNLKVKRLREIKRETNNIFGVYEILNDKMSETDPIYLKYTKIEKLYEEIMHSLLKTISDIKYKNKEESKVIEENFILWIHQIKTPISALKLLVEDMQNSEEKILMKIELLKIREYVSMILNIQRLDRIFEDMHLENINLKELTEEALKKYFILFNYNENKLQIHDLDYIFLSDKKWFTLILDQFLSNAVKYTKKGMITIFVEDGVLKIKDTGVGISKENIKRVFDETYTGALGRMDFESTGFGMFFAKKISKDLGHRISIISEKGKGTEIQIKLKREKLDLI